MSNVKKILISGVFYTALGRYSGMVVNLIVTAILSRILTPGEFGTVAIATVLIVFFHAISHVGIGTAVVQKKELTDTDLSHIFSLTVYLAAMTSVLFFLSSGIIASYYSEPQLEGVCKVLTIQLFFSVINTVPNSLRLKNKDFKFLAFLSVVTQVIGGVLAIAAVWQGLGVYSLLLAPVFSIITVFIVNWLKYRIRFFWLIRWSSIQKIFSYSFFQFLFNMIDFCSRNLDSLFIGKYLGLRSLGYYEKSYRLMLLPTSQISHILISVVHPVFSDYQNDIRYITDKYLKTVKMLAAIGFPLSVFLFFTAQEVIILLFGDRWTPSVPVFQYLCISVGFQMLVSSAEAIFQTANATKYLFLDGLLSAVCTLLCLCLGLFVFKELNTTALLISLSFILNFFKSYFILFRRVLKQPMVLFFKQLLIPIGISLVIGAVLYPVHIHLHVPLLPALIVKGVISGLIFIGFAHHFRLFDRPLFPKRLTPFR